MLAGRVFGVDNALVVPRDRGTLMVMASSDLRPSTEPMYEVVWPKSPMGVQARRAAPRLDDLAGRRIGFLWDHLFRGDELFPVLAKELVQRYPSIEIVDHPEFGNTHGADENEMIAALPGELRARHVDAVVSGMGC